MPATIENLPLDVVFTIFEYLTPLPPVGRASEHPFISISGTSKALRSQLHSYLTHLILSHNAKALAKVQKTLKNPPQNAAAFGKITRKLLKYWLRATWTHCFACGKPSSRRAIMDSGVVCCNRCDKVHWGHKITMSEAMTKYSLKKEDLFGGYIPRNLGGPGSPPPKEDGIIPKRPGLKYGQFTYNNVFTTMFMEDDVRELACQKHSVSDIDLHLRTRREKYEQRQSKMEENKRKKRNYIRRLATANGLNPTVTEHRLMYRLGERKKATIIGLLRNELLLKKLGLEYADSGSNWGWSYNEPLQNSNSRCLGYITRLLQHNRFRRVESWEDRRALDWGGDDCRFQRKLYLMKKRDKDNEITYVYEEDLETESDSGMSTYDDDEEDIFYETTPYFPYGSDIPLADEVKPSDANLIPLKNYCGEYPDEDLERIIYERKTGGPSAYAWLVYGSRHGANLVSLTEWADPVDYCLFLQFIEEFGHPDVPPPTKSYQELREIYRDKDSLIASHITPFTAPWSWCNYPLYVEEVPLEDYSSGAPPPPTQPEEIGESIAVRSNIAGGTYGKVFSLHSSAKPHIMSEEEKASKAKEEKEAALKRQRDERRIRTKNAKLRCTVDEMATRIRRVVRKYGWDLLGEEEGEAWNRAIVEDFDEDEEEECEEGGEDGKGRSKAKSKGKGKAKAKPKAGPSTRKVPERKSAAAARKGIKRKAGELEEGDDGPVSPK